MCKIYSFGLLTLYSKLSVMIEVLGLFGRTHHSSNSVTTTRRSTRITRTLLCYLGQDNVLHWLDYLFVMCEHFYYYWVYMLSVYNVGDLRIYIFMKFSLKLVGGRSSTVAMGHLSGRYYIPFVIICKQLYVFWMGDSEKLNICWQSEY